nr:MAG TPA: STIV-A81-helix bundle, Hyperthermophilic viral protein.7A [Caudoviricetes sp.]
MKKIYIVIEDKKRVFGHSEFLLANARPRVYHRTIVHERNASDSTR